MQLSTLDLEVVGSISTAIAQRLAAVDVEVFGNITSPIQQRFAAFDIEVFGASIEGVVIDSPSGPTPPITYVPQIICC